MPKYAHKIVVMLTGRKNNPTRIKAFFYNEIEKQIELLNKLSIMKVGADLNKINKKTFFCDRKIKIDLPETHTYSDLLNFFKNCWT